MAEHICGIYYVLDKYSYHAKRYYLPQVELKSHTTISRLYYTTKLQQRFANSSDKIIEELRYTFPLYDGVSVGAYTIKYGDTVLTGIVKQKDDARQTYDEAVERGETASLLESLPAGIFGVTIGNLPANTAVDVEITYGGELKHDAGIDGLRYMLPTSIAPRYGAYPGETGSHVVSKGINIVVDIDTGRCNIRKIQSPSHGVAVSMGAVSGAETDAFDPTKASATLTAGTTELGADFILQLVVDNIDSPQAVSEKHPTLDSRAVMATLVPKFNLPQASPEIVFIADQSGSMMGEKNTELVAAMEVFLRSLPFGVRFNICAFGSSYKYLWRESQAYNEKHLKESLKFVKSFEAQYGGTEMYEPIKHAFDKRLKDLPLEIVLLTDGEIWGESQLFDLINEKIRTDKIDARLFALGIGADVSHTLVEGVARVGNGFAQFITKNEEIDKKIIRSLKGCLYPHLKDYTMEVNFTEMENDDSDDFEIVEKITNQLQIEDPPAYEASEIDGTSTSFFDDNAKKDEPVQAKNVDRYAHLPKLQLPKILQAPTEVPPLYPSNRSTVYFLLGPDAPKQSIASITLRAVGPAGPLKLTIPVYTQPEPATTLHQLAARKAVQELEEGRGWLHEAKTVAGGLVRETHKSRFDELVEQEAVRLGTSFGVAGRWTSFVATKDDATDAESRTESSFAGQDRHDISTATMKPQAPGARSMARRRAAAPRPAGSGPIRACMMSTSAAMPPPPPAPMSFGGGLFARDRQVDACYGAPAAARKKRAGGGALQTMSNAVGGLFGRPSSATAGVVSEGGLFGHSVTPSPSPMGAPPGATGFASGGSLFGNTVTPSPPPMVARLSRKMDVGSMDEDADAIDTPMDEETSEPASVVTGTPLRTIIACQKFDDSWTWSKTLANILTAEDVAEKPDDQKTTILVLAYLEKHLGNDKDVWEMVAEKARAWLTRTGTLDIDQAIAEAKSRNV